METQVKVKEFRTCLCVSVSVCICLCVCAYVCIGVCICGWVHGCACVPIIYIGASPSACQTAVFAQVWKTHTRAHTCSSSLLLRYLGDLKTGSTTCNVRTTQSQLSTVAMTAMLPNCLCLFVCISVCVCACLNSLCLGV